MAVADDNDDPIGEPPTAASEKRRAPRRRVLKAAVIAYADRHCTMPCAVRDISASGARLRVDNPLQVPDTFELLIELDGLEADCEVVTRKSSEVGVRFLGPPRQAPPRRAQVVAPAAGDRRAVTLRRKPRAGG